MTNVELINHYDLFSFQSQLDKRLKELQRQEDAKILDVKFSSYNNSFSALIIFCDVDDEY